MTSTNRQGKPARHYEMRGVTNLGAPRLATPPPSVHPRSRSGQAGFSTRPRGRLTLRAWPSVHRGLVTWALAWFACKDTVQCINRCKSRPCLPSLPCLVPVVCVCV